MDPGTRSARESSGDRIRRGAGTQGTFDAKKLATIRLDRRRCQTFVVDSGDSAAVCLRDCVSCGRFGPRDYQTTQRCAGGLTIGDPALQAKACWNSGAFDSGPITR